MKLTIGVMGSSGGALDEAARAKACLLGEAIATRDAILITGGCPGLPYEAVRGAKAKGGIVVGISPGLSIDEHRGKYASPTDWFDVRPDLHGQRTHGAGDHQYPLVQHRRDCRGPHGHAG